MAVTELLDKHSGIHLTVPVGVDAATDLYATLDAAAVVTITASALPVYVRNVVCSYSAAPTGGALTITQGATTFFSIDITTAGPHVIPVDLKFAGGANVVVTLADPGGTVVSKLNVNAYRLQ